MPSSLDLKTIPQRNRDYSFRFTVNRIPRMHSPVEATNLPKQAGAFLTLLFVGTGAIVWSAKGLTMQHFNLSSCFRGLVLHQDRLADRLAQPRMLFLFDL